VDRDLEAARLPVFLIIRSRRGRLGVVRGCCQDERLDTTATGQAQRERPQRMQLTWPASHATLL
jgi:hypothetical protein